MPQPNNYLFDDEDAIHGQGRQQDDPPGEGTPPASDPPKPDLSAMNAADLAAELVRRGYASPQPPQQQQQQPPDPKEGDDDTPNVLQAIEKNAVKQATDNVWGVMSKRDELLEQAIADTREQLKMLPEGGEAEFRRVLGRIKPDELEDYVKSGSHHHAATYLVGQAAKEGKLRVPRPRSGPAPVGGGTRDSYETSQELDEFTRAFGAPPKSKRALAILQSGGSK